MKKKIYISGPITSLCNIDEARSRFAYAERQLMLKGYRVVNPFFNGLSETDSWADHMREDLKLMLDCDAIYLLRGWEYSDGAVIEEPYNSKTMDEACRIMGEPISWAPGLLLRADGYETEYYKKD